ncbi:hypothetical protein BT63DRAFT_419635 [Microthyrium microscopicum]|uniref:LCCL domain-containing protein n=1 Tax=Microthyrium microscopicum TaxID=703497 RepID=A0A6A6URF5_9PEZI|nr:hypothetical protein BT63DRAFT_419635 [Microthyrium microscopicum]
MAAPEKRTIKDLNGKWTMNKTQSDPVDPILQLQGIGWIIRKAIGMMTVTLIVKQYTDEEGIEHIDIVQPGAAGIKGTEEKRSIPQGDEKLWTDHEDHVFGHVKGYTQWRKLSDLGDDEDNTFVKDGWIDATETFIDGTVESQGNGWTARQVWGFALVDGVRKNVRRVVVKKGDKVVRARLVYDYVEDLRN